MFEHMRNAILRKVNNPGHLSCPPFFLFKSLLTIFYLFYILITYSPLLLLHTNPAFLLSLVPPPAHSAPPSTPPLSLFRKAQASHGCQQNKTHQVEAIPNYPPASRMDYSHMGNNFPTPSSRARGRY